MRDLSAVTVVLQRVTGGLVACLRLIAELDWSAMPPDACRKTCRDCLTGSQTGDAARPRPGMVGHRTATELRQ
ncbi:MAG: hypothetical protein NXH74_00520 [Rhodobacteraceae bacterium]|nr:hypothetical protein [Paracoccaceae bacterium]